MSSLYDITMAIATYEMEFDSDGVWINEGELDALNIEKDEKIENLLLWAKNLLSEADAIRAEKKTLDSREKSRVNKAENILDYVSRVLDGDKFSTPRVEVKWRKSTQTVVPDIDAVPDEYCDISVSRKPVKAKIKEYLEGIEGSDETCSWAHLEKKNNMSIK